VTSENENTQTIPGQETSIQNPPNIIKEISDLNKTPFSPPDQINNNEPFKELPIQIDKKVDENELPKKPKPSVPSPSLPQEK